MSIIKALFRFIWGTLTFIRNSLVNVLFLIFIIVIITSLIPKEPPVMPSDIALHVAPTGMLVDQYEYVTPLTRIMEQDQDAPETRVDELTKAIKSAAADDRITSLVLNLNGLTGGSISKLQEIGEALDTFKATAKPIIAIGAHYTQEQYYLASYADTIYMNPMGGVLVSGYASYRNYFKDAFDKLALNFHVFRTGPYKDAVEPFIANEMSPASKENNSLWLNDLWRSYTQNTEQQRQLSSGSLDQYIGSMNDLMAQHNGDAAKLALSFGLVDELATKTQQHQFMEDRFGKSDDKPFRSLSVREYNNYTKREAPATKDNIGLIVARGTILDGEQPAGTIGGDTMITLIRQAMKDDSIKAVVLRIDSGGGSAIASEDIRQELEALREQGKPVFVSMGSVAASGGYWMAMAADEVWATTTTITGSIGVFSAFPTLENSLANMGIHTDGIATTPLAGALRLDRGLSPQIENIMQQTVDHIYHQFIQLVANARQMSPEAVHNIAQGRVWSGSKALELGLVDKLGSLNDVIEAAAASANLDNYSVKEVREPLTPSEMIAEQIANDLQLNSWLGDHTSLLNNSLLNDSLLKSSPLAQNNALSSLLRVIEQVLPPLNILANSKDPRAIYAQCIECVSP